MSKLAYDLDSIRKSCTGDNMYWFHSIIFFFCFVCSDRGNRTFFFFLYGVILETASHSVAHPGNPGTYRVSQAGGLKAMVIFLPQAQECWQYKHGPPRVAKDIFL